MSFNEHFLSVLVVDDDQDTVDSTVTMLDLLGHDVHAAYSGAEALFLAVNQQPDVILLDLSMPDMDGWELADRLRASAYGKPPLLIAMTGCGSDEDKRRSGEAGIHLHLVKPVDAAVLEGLLRRIGRTISMAAIAR